MAYSWVMITGAVSLMLCSMLSVVVDVVVAVAVAMQEDRFVAVIDTFCSSPHPNRRHPNPGLRF